MRRVLGAVGLVVLYIVLSNVLYGLDWGWLWEWPVARYPLERA